MRAKSLTVITPVVPSGAKEVRLFVESTKRHGLNVVQFGQGEIWSTVGSDTQHQYELAPELINGLRTTDLILFSDSFDAFFCSGAEEIIRKFERMGADVVYSAEQDLYPPKWGDEYERLFGDEKWAKGPWNKPNCGGWIGTKECVLETLNYLRENYKEINEAQPRFIRAFMDGKLPWCRLDVKCQIFQTMSGGLGGNLGVMERRPERFFNMTTGEEPVIIHFNNRAGLDGKMERYYKRIYGI